VIDPKDIAVVIHTCPERAPKLGTLLESVQASDIVGRSGVDMDFQIATEPVGAKNYEKRLHYLMLLCRSARRAPYVLRLEDDIVVGRHIIHNLCTWPAVAKPDFGVGLAFVNHLLLEVPESSNVAQDEEGNLYRRQPKTPWAQAHLYESQALRQAVPFYFEQLREKGFRGAEPAKYSLAFDWAITGAMDEVGRRVYLHRPSLANCSEVADVRVGGRRLVMQHFATDFDPEWKR